MFDSIKITALPNIGSNLNFESLFPVVDMNGSPDTKKANLQILGNYILTNAGGPNFVQAAQATLAQSVTNAAQPNITSVGTLTSVAVTGNVNLGYLNNITIYGGNNGQYLQTDGNGNLAWVSGGGSGNGEVGGANSQIQFNDSGNFGGDAALTWDAGNAQLNTVKFAASSAIIYVDAAVGNLEANVVKTDNYQYANGDPFTGEYSNANVANYLLDYTGNISAGYFIGNGSQLTGITATAEGAGPNLSIQFNNNSVFDGNANLTYDVANSTLVATNVRTDNLAAIDMTLTGNVAGVLSLNVGNVNANYFNGDGTNITNVVATSANIANTANAVAVANVVGIGNIATIALDGSSSNILYGNGVFAAAPNVSLTGDGGNLSNINAGNIVGTVANANLSQYLNVTEVSNNFSYHVVLSAGPGDNSLHIDSGDNLQYDPAAGLLTAVRMDAQDFVGNLYYAYGYDVSNVAGIGNIATINLDGNISNVLTGNGTFTALPIIDANTVLWTAVPVSNTSPGTPGQAAYDVGGNLFVCVATNTWSKFSGTTSW